MANGTLTGQRDETATLSLSYRQTLARLRSKEAQLAKLDEKAMPIRKEIERLRALLRDDR